MRLSLPLWSRLTLSLQSCVNVSEVEEEDEEGDRERERVCDEGEWS